MSISKANSDNIPGVNGSNKCGENKFTNNCNKSRIVALIILPLVVDLDLTSPQPNIVTKSGAAKPPKPATRYAIQVSEQNYVDSRLLQRAPLPLVILLTL